MPITIFNRLCEFYRAHSKPADKYVYAGVLLLFLLSCFLPPIFASRGGLLRLLHLSHLSYRSDGLRAAATCDGAPLAEVMLPAPGEAAVEVELDSEYGFNLLSVTHDGIMMISSDCRGGDCLRFPRMGRKGSLIVCLPHKLIVRITSGEQPETADSDIDAVAY